MSESVAAGTWVEIHAVVLAAGTRAPQVPGDTQGVPLEMTVKGFLLGDARLGDAVEIHTPSGRRLSGMLNRANPAYEHGFGPPIPALSTIADEVRAILSKEDEQP